MKLLLVFLIAAVAVVTAKPGYLGGGGFGGGHGGFSGGYGGFTGGYGFSGGHGGGGGGGGGHGGYAAYGPAHIAVGHGGYVLDTPEVAAHRAAHLSAVAQTHARDAVVNAHDAAYGYGGGAGHGGGGGYGGHGHHG